MKVSEVLLGNASDKNIYERLIAVWKNTSLVKNNTLQDSLNKAIDRSDMTGYNLFSNAVLPDFDEDMTIIYGHSDISHALQLVALLNSENYDPRIQLVPKTSAFLYLKERGSSSYPVVEFA